jgi:hypothetical protein
MDYISIEENNSALFRLREELPRSGDDEPNYNELLVLFTNLPYSFVKCETTVRALFNEAKK